MNLILLIEEAHRELQSRLLLAARAVERGHRVILGQQWLLSRNFARLPRGIVLFKGNNAVQADNMMTADAAGHLVTSIEEEALGLADAREIRRLYDPRCLSCCALLITQGRVQSDALTAAWPEVAERVRATGNPRTDLLRPPLNAKVRAAGDRMRERFGRFLLINTNFGSINPASNDVLGYFRR